MTKLVSGRLKAQTAPGTHPGPELLAAFAENALPEADRGQLLQHLGGCSDCREILYLALPDSPEAQKILVLQPRPFIQWALGWGALAASIAAVAVFVTTNRLERKNQTTPMVTTAPAATTETETKIASDKTPPELDQLKAARSANQSKVATTLTTAEPKPQPEAKHMTAKLQPELVFEQSGEVRVRAQQRSADAGALAKKDEKQKENPGAPALSGAATQTGSAGKPEVFGYAVAEPSKSRTDQPAAGGQQASAQADAVSESKSVQAEVSSAQATTTLPVQGRNTLDDLPASSGNGNLSGSPQPTGGSAQDRTTGAASSGLRLAHGSTVMGNLGGIIVDPSGAVIGKAKITMVGPAGAKTASSDPEGRFSFDLLPPGSYSIRAEASGFKVAEIRQVAVLDNKTSNIRIRLNPGSASEAVEVSAAAPSVGGAVEMSGATPALDTSTGYVAGQQQTSAELSVKRATAAKSQH